MFLDQKKFMELCGQTTQIKNKEQFRLYKTLISEESKELLDACENNDITEIFDGLLDVIVCAIGAGVSTGVNAEYEYFAQEKITCGKPIIEQHIKAMTTCSQTTKKRNIEQFNRHKSLIYKQLDNFYAACNEQEEKKIIASLVKLISHCIHAGLSLGLPMQKGWDEVVRSNMAKVDHATNTIKKRSDGKILKPDNWTPPRLAEMLSASIDACME
jgi:predicted HAD superfamily Cof-like phosphohydrolase